MSKGTVVKDMFDDNFTNEVEHISLAKKADIIIVVPASANIIGKISNGIADDMLSTTIMASKATVIFAPAMNDNMYSNLIVQDNIERLKEYGYKFIEPINGHLACDTVGVGKLANVETIIDFLKMVIENE